MSHEVEQMMYVGETPWHGLGVKLERPPTIEEAIELAGLDWDVRLEPLGIPDRPGVAVPARASVRATDGSVLGVVGTNYRPLQNREAFRWFQPLLDSGIATLETAGSLREGRKVWILAKISSMVGEVVSGDRVNGYVLLSNSHDGSSTVRAGFVPIRVVCNNTLSMAHSSQDSALLRIRHTQNVDIALQHVRDVMDLATRSFVATIEQYRALAAHKVDAADLRRYVQLVYQVPSERALDKRMSEFEAVYNGGLGMGTSSETLWRGYNAITETTSWHRGQNQDTRLDALWFGTAGEINDRALSVGLQMVAGQV